MIVRIYFNCGEHLEFSHFDDSQDLEIFNDHEYISIIKEYIYCVGNNSQEWITALMVSADDWYPFINLNNKKLPVNLTGYTPDASGTIRSNIISAIYVMDNNAEKLYFYFITNNAEPRGIDPDHYKNKGVVIDLSDEFLQWYRKGLEELQ